ncbi:hypothetical protein GCM10009527_073210 [Actinomadura nitritigenes]
MHGQAAQGQESGDEGEQPAGRPVGVQEPSGDGGGQDGADDIPDSTRSFDVQLVTK